MSLGIIYLLTIGFHHPDYTSQGRMCPWQDSQPVQISLSGFQMIGVLYDMVTGGTLPTKSMHLTSNEDKI